MRKKTQEQWVEEVSKIHKDVYDYSLVHYDSAHIPIEIICRVDGHGSFRQSPSNHLQGHGCPRCQAQDNSKRRVSNTEAWVKKAHEIHGDRYDYSKVVYLGRHEKVTIVCEHHGDFEQTPGNHLHPSGCPECAKDARGEKRSYTPEQWIAKATQKHGDRYDYSESKYIRSNIKVTILCRAHGPFKQSPANHLMGQHCPSCQKEFQDKAKRDTTVSFIEKAHSIHGQKYDYSRVEYVLSTASVLIGCPTPEHGFFWQKPAVHLQGNGCPQCGVESVSALKYSNTADWTTKAKLVHGNRYDYSRVEYKSAKNQVEIGCPEHGFFWQIADNHLQGRRCPRCANSLGEIAVEDHLVSRSLPFAREVRFKECCDIAPLPFDFIVRCAGQDYAIEFHGIQHYQAVRFSYSISEAEAERNLIECKRRDAIKADWCRVNGIPLLVIPYGNINQVPVLIDAFLLD